MLACGLQLSVLAPDLPELGTSGILGAFLLGWLTIVSLIDQRLAREQVSEIGPVLLIVVASKLAPSLPLFTIALFLALALDIPHLRRGVLAVLLAGTILIVAGSKPWILLLACFVVAALFGRGEASREALEAMFSRQTASQEKTVAVNLREFQAKEAGYQHQLGLSEILDRFQERALASDTDEFYSLLLKALTDLDSQMSVAVVERGESGEIVVVSTAGFALQKFLPLPSISKEMRIWSSDGKRLCFLLSTEHLILCIPRRSREEIEKSGFLYQILARAHLLLRILKQNAELTRLVADKSLALEQLESSQARMLRSERLAAVGQLAAGVAHEINSPLAAIELQVDLINRRLEKGNAEGVKQSLEVVREAGGKAKAIIETLLDFSRPPGEGRSAVVIDALVRKSLDFLYPHLEAEGIELKQELDEGLELDVNSQEVSQILTNLVLNAKDALLQRAEGRRILVRLTATESCLELTVANNGPAIAEEVLPRLFDPFFTTKAPGEGTGLGLYISSSLAARNGAALKVAHEQGWVVFRLIFPRAN